MPDVSRNERFRWRPEDVTVIDKAQPEEKDAAQESQSR